MGVDLFGAQFASGRRANDGVEGLARTTLPPTALELEITENIIMRHDETRLEPLRRLRALGIGVALNDFGTGFASLSLLKRFPLTPIKIDRSFVRDICIDQADAAIVTALVLLAGGHPRSGWLPFGAGLSVARPMPFDELARWIDRPLALMAG